MSMAWVRLAHSAVSTTSDDVSPKWIHAPSGIPMRSWTTVDEGGSVVIGHEFAFVDRVNETRVHDWSALA